MSGASRKGLQMMDQEAMRESTLVEWVMRMDESHLVRKQWVEMLADIAECSMLREQLATALQKIDDTATNYLAIIEGRDERIATLKVSNIDLLGEAERLDWLASELHEKICSMGADYGALKNELEAVEEECTSLRNMILSQDEKLDASQYSGNLEDE